MTTKEQLTHDELLTKYGFKITKIDKHTGETWWLHSASLTRIHLMANSFNVRVGAALPVHLSRTAQRTTYKISLLSKYLTDNQNLKQ